MTPSANAHPDVSFPDLTRQDAGIALISPWGHGADESDLFSRARRENPPGLLSLTRFSADSGQELHYAQWTDDASCLRWLDDADAPPARYVVYRGYRADDAVSGSGTGNGNGPTMLATPRFACAGRDSQQRLAETIVEVLTALSPPGLLGAHLHLSVDGSRVVNYAEWTDEAAWRAFVGGPAQGRMRAAFDGLDGVRLLNTPQGVARYRLDETRP
ncbi:antibiotic biosynthesis monooxygenase [Streptomyces sp. NBC_01506]|uniref:antibiotic biosynthesis monooxygenase n=1 Tax=Streptomyces sp. NBC_01506 TaxID=2903887 RepID=UPI0038633674